MNDKLIAHTAEKTISARNFIANLAAEKNLELAKSIKGFNELYGKKKELEILLSKNCGDEKVCTELYENLEKTNEKLETLLKEKGLTLTNLVPNFYCKICGDTGLVDGKTCKCKKELIAKLEQRELGTLSGEFTTISEIESPDLAKSFFKKYSSLVSKMQSFCEKFPNVSARFLVFTGKSGTGKTYMAKAVANELDKKGFQTLCISAFSLNNLFLKYHTSFDESLSETFNSVIETPVLFIDDLGTEPTYRNVTKEYFTNIVNERNQSGKITVVTTNLSPENVAASYDQRLASRLFDKNCARTVYFDFPDLRKKS